MLHRPVPFLLVPILLALLLLPVLAFADEVPDGSDLEDLLAAYDRRGGGNTIPIEKAILALREAGAVDDLADHLGHHRFGATIAWALATHADEALARRIVAAVGRWNEREQGMAAATLARLPDGAGLPILQEMGARESLPGWARPLVSGALLAAGDPDTVGAVKKGLRAKEPEAVATALKAVAHSHDPAWLPALSSLRTDERELPQKVRSHFKVRSTKEGPHGTIHMAVSPELATVGQLALEAANRVVQPDTPEMIAWWYELEKGPRFGFGEGGARKLRHHVSLDRKAADQGLPTASAAINAVLAAIRREDPEAKSFVLEKLGLGRKAWVVTATVGPEVVTATVDADGTVTRD